MLISFLTSVASITFSSFVSFSIPILCVAFSFILVLSVPTLGHTYEEYGLCSNRLNTGTENLIIKNKTISDSDSDKGITIAAVWLKSTGYAKQFILDSNLTISNSDLITTGAQSSTTLYGGHFSVSAGSTNTITGNSISIISSDLIAGYGKSISLYGVYVESMNKFSTNHTITGNSIYIANSNLAIDGKKDGFNLYGGYVDSSSGSGSHTVSENSIYITDSSLTADTDINIYGGFASSSSNDDHTVTNNTITLSGTVNLTASGNITISGGFIDGDSIARLSGDVQTNHTLVLSQATVNLNAGEGKTSTIKNFKNYVIKPLSHAQIINNTPILTATHIELGTDANITTGGGILGGDSKIPINHEFTL